MPSREITPAVPIPKRDKDQIIRIIVFDAPVLSGSRRDAFPKISRVMEPVHTRKLADVVVFSVQICCFSSHVIPPIFPSRTAYP